MTEIICQNSCSNLNSNVTYYSFSEAMVESLCIHMQSTLPETDSVYQLITQLCKLELKEQGTSYVLKKVRSTAFGILLKKTPAAFGDSEHPPWYDPLLALQLDLPETKSSQLADCLKRLSTAAWNCSKDDLKQILSFISALANSVPAHKEDFVTFKPGQLDADFLKQYPNAYPQYDPRIFALPPIEKFVSTVYGTECPYLPPGGWYPFCEPPGTGLSKFFRIDYPRGTEQDGGVVPYDIPDFPELKGPKQLFISEGSKKRDRTPDEGYETPAADIVHIPPECSVNDHSAPKDCDLLAHLYHRTWEAFGSRLPPCEKPFLCEKSEAVHRLWLLRMRQQAIRRVAVAVHGSSQLKVLQRDQLLAHIRYLLDGIPSETFPYNEDLEAFTADSNICVEGISPDTLQSFLSSFLVLGSLIYKLEILVQSPPDSCCLAYKAICGCVQHYLWLYRGELLRQEFTEGLLALAGSIRRYVMPQLFCIAHILSQPSICTADMLSQLHDAAVRAVCPATTPLLAVMLSAGASIYLRFVEQWLFEGKLDDTQEEFFVCARPTMSVSRTRSYWKMAFYVNKKIVPSFLSGLEYEILDCGRAVNLLRICCPKNPLLQELEKGFPHLRLCGSLEQLKQLEDECSRFEERVSTACGLTECHTARDILVRCQIAKSDLSEMASDARKQQEKKIQAEMQEKHSQKIQEKKQQMEQLQAQMAEAKEQRLAERRREEAEDEKLRQHNERQKQQEILIKEKEKQKIMLFYEELSKEADRRKFTAEWRMRRMKLNDKRKHFLLNDPLCSALTSVQLCEEKIHHAVDTCLSETNTLWEAPDQANNNNLNERGTKVPESHLSTSNIMYMETNGNNAVDSSANCLSLDDAVSEKNAGEREMTDAQKNRMKVLQSEFGISITQPNNILNKQTNYKNILTEADQNKRKMMWSEYNVITGVNYTNPFYSKTETWNGGKDGDSIIPYTQTSVTDKLNHNFIDTNVGIKAETEPLNPLDEISLSIKYNEAYEANNILLPKHHNKSSVSEQSEILIDSSEACLQHISDITVGINKNDYNGLTPEENEISIAAELIASTSVVNELVTNTVQENQKLDDTQKKSVLGYESSTDFLNVDETNTSPVFDEHQMDFNKCTAVEDLDSDMPTHYGLSVFSTVHTSYSFDMPAEVPFPIRDITDRFFHGCIKQHTVSDKSETETVEAGSLQRSVLLPLQSHTRLVNGALLKYFLHEESLLGHLESLRNYFLLQDGEFSQLLSTQLFQGAHETVHPSSLLNVFTLNRVLARALSGSPQAERDVNSSRLCFSLSGPTTNHLSRTSPDTFSSLVLGYSVEWPLCLILTDSALTNYNTVFGFLLKVRRVAWVLEQNFKVLRLPAQYARNEHHRIHLCRHEMMQFVHGLQSYIMSTVLQASWAEFETLLGNAVSLDDLYHFHADYLKTILYKCLLFEKTKQVLELLVQVFSLILKFCEMVHSGLKMGALLKTFNDYQKAVSHWLQFVTRISDSGFQPYLANLVLSLNVSGYYKNV